MSRGITKEEVWQACDALLLAGERPTIEKVRLALGRGSPNTVSPMLDEWFRKLGTRLQDPKAFAAPAEIPEPVQAAAKHFWEAAQAESRRDFDERLKTGLADAEERARLERERADTAARSAAEAMARANRLQEELAEREAELVRAREAHGQTRDELSRVRHHAEGLQTRLDQALGELVEVRAKAQKSVDTAVARFEAAERRAALEIDVARVAATKADQRSTALEHQLEAMRQRLQEQNNKASRLEAENTALMTRIAGLSDAMNDALRCKEQLQSAEVELQACKKELAAAREAAAGAKTAAEVAERVLSSLKLAKTTPTEKPEVKPSGSRGKSK
jgi:DNA repair exonuclease SbcCD ATPase subunit